MLAMMTGHKAAWHRDLNLFMSVNLYASIFLSAWNIPVQREKKQQKMILTLFGVSVSGRRCNTATLSLPLHTHSACADKELMS